MKAKIKIDTVIKSERVNGEIEMEVSVKEMVKYAEAMPYIFEQLKTLETIMQRDKGEPQVNEDGYKETEEDLREELKDAYSRALYWEERAEKKSGEILRTEELLEEAEASVSHLQEVIRNKDEEIDELKKKLAEAEASVELLRESMKKK